MSKGSRFYIVTALVLNLWNNNCQTENLLYLTHHRFVTNDSENKQATLDSDLTPIVNSNARGDILRNISSDDLEKSGRRAGFIVGGQIVEIESFPFIISIQYLDGRHFCGGSLIKTDWILTAAHCISDDDKASDIYLLAGESDAAANPRSSGAQFIQAKYLFQHSEYDRDTVYNDIALIVSVSDFELTNTVNLIPIATFENNQDLDVTELSDVCIVIGWGNTEAQRRADLENPLKFISIPLISWKICRRHYPLNSKQMCAMYPEGGKDPCFGDSGGPLVWKTDGRYLLQGVVSYGAGCARPNTPGVYTRVDAYTEWILDHEHFFIIKSTPINPSESVTDLTQYEMQQRRTNGNEQIRLSMILWTVAYFSSYLLYS